MTYKVNIHKRKIYLKPRPKEDIKDGLVVVLNKPRGEEKEPFISTDITTGKKEYPLPELPQGVWITNVFIKNGRKDKN